MTSAPDLVLRLPETGRDGAIVVALSGGLDSTVLLHALAAMPIVRARGLRAIHVHHGLHVDADAWSIHCAVVCEALRVPLHVARVHVDKRAGVGLEAAARAARRDAFTEALDAGDVLALAHHRDDQAETFLLRALRASGPDGLGAMRALQPFARGFLWRPWLDVPRADLIAYAQAHVLAWIDDPSNDALEHDRNFLRHQVLPLLRERWPHADAAFARAAMLSAEAADLLAEDDARALDAARTEDPAILSVNALRALDPTRRARVLRRWIAAASLPPLPAEGIAQIEADLLHGADDADFRFSWAGAHVRRWCDRLRADRDAPALPADWSDTWDGRGPLILPDGGTLELDGVDAFDAPLRVRLRRGGERIALPGRSHSHSLKHALQDAGLPTWDRERLPLLVDAGDQVLAAGPVLADVFARWLQDHDARLRWTPPPAT
jgi:tRNA(Ile)-lysidine synthase